MPGTADPDRIRRIRREAVYARYSDPAILADFPTAQDGYDQVRESFCSNVDDAQFFVDELAANVAVTRGHEAAETDTPLSIGRDVPIEPALPRARMVDRSVELDAEQTVKALSVDFHTDRNSIETIG